MQRDPLLPRRVVLATVGMLLAGVSLGFFKRAFFGVDPTSAWSTAWPT